jgi:hypothetical protein
MNVCILKSSLEYCSNFDELYRSRGGAPERRSKGEAPERRSKGEAPERRSKGKAPEHRSKGEAPECRSKGEAPERRLSYFFKVKPPSMGWAII